MTDHKYHAARFARTPWWCNGKVTPNLLIGAVALAAYLVFPFADNSPPAQGASEPAVPAGPTTGYAADATPESRPADEHPVQTYTTWLRAAHAHAALYGQDAPLPSQF